MDELINKNIGGEQPQLEQFGILMSYLQYENTTFWTRAGFFLLAHTALLGFVVQVLPPFNPCHATWERIGISVISGISGLLLARIWWKALKAGEWWINRWHNCLLELEPQAFGNIQVLRGVFTLGQTKDHKKKPGARAIAYQVTCLFSILWVLVFTWGIVIGLLKLFAI